MFPTASGGSSFTVMLPGEMALPEDLKKLNTSWDALRVLSQPLTWSCTLVVVQ